MNSARKTMPVMDYVSVLRSVYTDQKATLGGTLASVLMSGIGAYKTSSPALCLVAVAFLVIGIARYFDTRAFWSAQIDGTDPVAAEHWENRAVWLGGSLGLVYGLWCLVSLVFVDDTLAALSSVSISIAAMVGICARNFGLDRLVSVQMVMVIIPMSLGLALHGESFYVVLSCLLLVMLFSFRKLASDIRNILLSAVHGRMEATRLAAELDIAITTLEHGLCMLDENGTLTVMNAHVAATLKTLGVNYVANRPFTAILADMSRAGQVPRTAIDRLNEMVNRRISGKVLLSAKSGRYYEITISNKQDRCVLLFEDISDRVAAEERISVMARQDSLTNLPNRQHFSELAVAELALRSTGLRPSAMMIFDIDEFKHINDSYGHIIGDDLLRSVAQRLSTSLPSGTILGRLGGDEFVALSPHDSNLEDITNAVAATLAEFRHPFVVSGLHLTVQMSIGIATSENSADELTELMTKADLALYAAKAAGRGCSRVFHVQMDRDYHYRQRLKADLKTAIETGTLSLAFQPQVDITSRKIVSCEALARWEHPQLGNIAPSVFIPLAEESGLISELTEWVIDQAARECASWPAEISVAVNVSARDFRGTDLAKVITCALRTHNLPAHRLEIEVTETAVIEERDLAKTVLNELAAMGIAIGLDDFGTGYSSLSYLHTLPFTKLKIDRAFISDIADNDRARLLLANVARLGRDLNLTVVAEGVETEAQLNTLTAITSVQQVQGYFFSRPLPPRDIAELITRVNCAGKPRKTQQFDAMVNAR
nr:EAL domain-containing protein [Devosia sp. MC1541]